VKAAQRFATSLAHAEALADQIADAILLQKRATTMPLFGTLPQALAVWSVPGSIRQGRYNATSMCLRAAHMCRRVSCADRHNALHRITTLRWIERDPEIKAVRGEQQQLRYAAQLRCAVSVERCAKQRHAKA